VNPQPISITMSANDGAIYSKNNCNDYSFKVTVFKKGRNTQFHTPGLKPGASNLSYGGIYTAPLKITIQKHSWLRLRG